jgi:hypothetical protein
MAAILCGCGPKQAEVERRIENGVEVVLNHLEPCELMGEASTLHLEEILSIDTEREEIAETGLVSMSNIAVDSSGNIFLMLRSSNDKFVYKFSAEGEFITSFCRKGQGPGEAEWGGSLLVDERDRIIAKDMTKKIVFLFGNDGTYIKETRLDVNHAVSLIEYMGDNRFILSQQQMDGPESIFHNRIGIGGLDLSAIKELYHYEFQDALFVPRYTPVPRGFITGVTNEYLYIGNSGDEYEILVFDLEGELVRKIRKEYSPVGIPEQYKEQTKKNLSRFGRGQELLKKLYFPAHWAPFRYAFTDDEGRLYVMTYETDAGGNEYLYDIFNSEGAFISRISLGNIQVRYVEGERISDSPTSVLVRGQKLYRIGEKNSGFMELKVYKMIWD